MVLPFFFLDSEFIIIRLGVHDHTESFPYVDTTLFFFLNSGLFLVLSYFYS